MPSNKTTAPSNENTTDPTEPSDQTILLWHAGGVMHEEKPAWEVCFVLETEVAADAWREWLQHRAPGRGNAK